MTNEIGVPAHLSSTLALLQRAFPADVDEMSYPALLVVLGEEMSMRNLADVVAVFTGKEWPYVYNDVLRALSPTGKPAEDVVERVRQCLLPYGYEEWLQDEG